MFVAAVSVATEKSVDESHPVESAQRKIMPALPDPAYSTLFVVSMVRE